MKSPLRICLGATLVVHLLLFISTTVTGNALPAETTTNLIKEDRTARYTRVNGSSSIPRNRPSTPDVAVNELQPKESASQENNDKNAKYKDRGRIKFNSQVSTESALRKVKSSIAAGSEKLTIVTPTAPIKKPSQIIDSMKTYKKTKMPVSSTSPLPSNSDSSSTESEEYYDSKEYSRKYLLNKYNIYSAPSYKYHKTAFEPLQNNGTLNKKNKEDYTTSFDLNSFLAVSDSDENEKYKSKDIFNFDSDLTTPKNDFFDKRYQEISSDIANKLVVVKSRLPSKNGANIVVKENIGFDKTNNSLPSNRSRVIIKNTKEIHLLDNEEAGSSNKELSDVQGTSIYYEMSVLSTETYSLNQTNDDDCDNDSSHSEPSEFEKDLSERETQTPLVSVTSKPLVTSTSYTQYFPFSTAIPTSYSSVNSIPYSIQHIVTSTESSSTYSNPNLRNMNYSKRLNLTRFKNSPNSVTVSTDTPYPRNRIPTRKFYHSTPKTRPIWMAPRRNITRNSYTKTTYPSTIYSEYFNIKDKYTTTSRPRLSNRTIFTTVSSDIDPVLQSDISGAKKVVQSQSISNNNIPSLSKRGSTKWGLTTITSSETDSNIGDLEIPPTLTAWALASMRIPPSMSNSMVNTTVTTHRSVDENELQKVSDVSDIKESTTSSTTTKSYINRDFTTMSVIDIDQDKLPWRPVNHSLPTSSEAQVEVTTEKNESLPDESNILSKSSNTQAVTNETLVVRPIEKNNEKDLNWVPVTEEDQTANEESQEIHTIFSVEDTKTTGFESITKLPTGMTTPLDESILSTDHIYWGVNTALPTTTDYEITTIRFSYIPTDVTTEAAEPEDTTAYVHITANPTKTKDTLTSDDEITTYRPKYRTPSDILTTETSLVTKDVSNIEYTNSGFETDKPHLETITKSQTSTSVVTEITTTEPNTIGMTPETVQTTSIFDEVPTEIEIVTVTEINPLKLPVTTEESTTEIIIPNKIEDNQTLDTTPVNKIEASHTTEVIPSNKIEEYQSISEENSGSNEVITLKTTKMTPSTTTLQPIAILDTTVKTTTEAKIETTHRITTTEFGKVLTSNEIDIETTISSQESDITTDTATKSVNDLEDISNYSGEMTTETSSRVLTDDSGSGVAIAVIVSTIGIITLILLIGLLLVVRRRGRRGQYAQRCTPVSLDAYSLDSVSVGYRKGNQRLRASKRSYGNPAYDDEVTSHPMQYAALANFALDVDSIIAEFNEIPSVSVRPDEVPPGCEDKNRYSNVLPLPETRVPLSRIGNDPTSEYINANYITGPGNIRKYYIACQAPLSNTVVDFWRMIWEQNSRLIVMLTEYMENGVEKCYEYLPPSEISDNKRTFGDYQIILKKREQREKYAISSVQLINMRTRTWREITHLWYFWPAKGVPDDYDSIIDFLSEMRSYMKISQTAKEFDEDGVEIIYGDQSRASYNNLAKLRSEDSSPNNGVNIYSPARAEEQMRRTNTTNGTLSRMKAASEVEGVRPCVLVCASGAGRSCALVALDVCARALAAGACDVPRCVRALRAQRPHALPNRLHYALLYQVLSEFGKKLMGGGIDTI